MPYKNSKLEKRSREFETVTDNQYKEIHFTTQRTVHGYNCYINTITPSSVKLTKKFRISR